MRDKNPLSRNAANRQTLLETNFITNKITNTADPKQHLASCRRGKNKTQDKMIQQAQLSQRERVMFCVIKYFAKSLKITQGHSK